MITDKSTQICGECWLNTGSPECVASHETEFSQEIVLEPTKPKAKARPGKSKKIKG